MLTKQGVSIANMDMGISRGLRIVDTMYKCIDEELIVTKTYKRDDGDRSLKYGKDAFDVRFPGMSRDTIVKGVSRVLGFNYIVLERGNHMYVKYDPKGYSEQEQEGV